MGDKSFALLFLVYVMLNSAPNDLQVLFFSFFPHFIHRPGSTEAQDEALPPVLTGGGKMQNTVGFIRYGGAEWRCWCGLFWGTPALS